MFDIDGLIAYIRREPTLNLSPVTRQALITRLSHDLTDKEIAMARDLVMGRVSVGNPN